LAQRFITFACLGKESGPLLRLNLQGCTVETVKHFRSFLAHKPFRVMIDSGTTEPLEIGLTIESAN
jgi:hypothetical protein